MDDTDAIAAKQIQLSGVLAEARSISEDEERTFSLDEAHELD